jgi:hypothetical protein
MQKNKQEYKSVYYANFTKKNEKKGKKDEHIFKLARKTKLE